MIKISAARLEELAQMELEKLSIKSRKPGFVGAGI
jgi:hypothetical protein